MCFFYSLLLNQTVSCSVCMQSFFSNSQNKRFPAETSNLYDTTQHFDILCIKHFLFIIFCSVLFDELFVHFINKKKFRFLDEWTMNISKYWYNKVHKIYAKNNFYHITTFKCFISVPQTIYLVSFILLENRRKLNSKSYRSNNFSNCCLHAEDAKRNCNVRFMQIILKLFLVFWNQKFLGFVPCKKSY